MAECIFPSRSARIPGRRHSHPRKRRVDQSHPALQGMRRVARRVHRGHAFPRASEGTGRSSQLLSSLHHLRPHLSRDAEALPARARGRDAPGADELVVIVPRQARARFPLLEGRHSGGPGDRRRRHRAQESLETPLMSIDPEHLLSALRRARGKGLSLKQLSGQLRLGQSQRHPLRRALADLMKHGRASYDGHVYREVEGHDRADGDRRTASGETPRPQSRRAPAAMIEGARMHRDKRPAQGARKPGAELTGVIHVKAEGYGFVSPLLGNGGREDDLFVPPQFTKGALDGDVVRARAIHGRDGRLDGEDARDFDDAVHVSRTPGGYRLVVAIADVASYVPPGGPLDREALRRATSVYFPGTVLPMLPERLSNGICSLNPDVDRLCTVCDLALDKSGTPLQADIYEAVMRSHARLTYTRVAEALAGDADPQLRPLLDDLKAAHELSKKLTRRRQLRGSIDFDLPEAKIVLDEQGRVAEIARRPRNDAHRLVEEFMLAANEAVARFFQVRGLPTVYRIHDQPDREKLDAFAALARSHGFDLPAGEELTPRVLNDFLKAVEGKPAQKALNSLLLRAMMQAQYSPDNIGHYGLAAPTYLHFTSPIRRYPDLMVHRLLKEHWARGGG